jgi:hypothetical protein
MAPDGQVRFQASGVRLDHSLLTRSSLRPIFLPPVVGDLDLSLESFSLAGRSQPEAPHLHCRAWVALPVRPASPGPLGRDHRWLRAGRLD